MSNHKSTESALKNLKVQVGQLAKQIVDKSSNSFVANIEKNPKEEFKVVMTRSKRFVEAEDEDSVVSKKKVAEKKGTDEKKDDVRGKSNQEKGKQIMVKKKELNDQEKEKEVEKEKEKEKNEKDMASKKRKSIGARPTAQRNLHKRLTNLVDGTIDVALVKEFYANLYSFEDPSPKQARFRGHPVKIDADSLNPFLETPVVLEEGETLPTYSRYCRLPVDHGEIEATLCIPGMGFILNAEGHLGRILRKDLTTLAQVWSVLPYSNLAPTSHTSNLTMDRASLIFGLVSHMDMNIGALISGQMTSIAQSNSSRGVVSDNLTFERLSPIINLAYIRKNYWNPDDLTVAFRGARKARARPADIPSTSAAPAPTPASTSTAPSVPAHPRTQPSLDRDGESPTAQVPQQVQDASSKTTIPESFTLHPKAGEEQARPETDATPERSLEGTSEPPTPVADLSSPQPAADPSTLVLDIPEDQTTPVLAPNTSPPATPVLHLTDEEDAQTQDTQDLSQDF
ncbi:hypothetical protein GmHk_04G010802 [Glycine max]|nr:hypothetical protein GmHk_04G010802 [Glycine max]